MDSGDFDYGSPAPITRHAGGHTVTNAPYDEAVDIEGSFDESLDTHAASTLSASLGMRGSGGRGSAARGSGRPRADAPDTPPRMHDMGGRGEYPDSDVEIPGEHAPASPSPGRVQGNMMGGDISSDSESVDAGDTSASQSMSPLRDSGNMSSPGGAGMAAAGSAGAGASTAALPEGYNPADFGDLAVSEDVAQLFTYIERYKPHVIALDTPLKPFIPDYIPAIGHVDAFLKPPRPDEGPEPLGLTVLDEPAAEQSDPTVLDLHLRAVAKKSHIEPQKVRSIPNALKRKGDIAKWIASITELHKSKPAPSVRYARPMPDIESLMQAWPDSVAALLEPGAAGLLPSADMDMSLEEMARTVCALCDIPVHDTPQSKNSLIQALHVLFTLYSEFATSQHFATT